MRSDGFRKMFCSASIIAICLIGLLSCPSTIFAETDSPATVFMQLAQPPKVGAPLNLTIEVGLHVAIDSIELTLTTPPAGEMDEENITLWSGRFDSNFPNSFNYTIPVLHPGKYAYSTMLRVKTSDGNNLEAKGNLFLEVRPNIVLTSPVSSERIRKLELVKEIKEKGLSNKSEKKLIIMPLEQLEHMINSQNLDK